MSPLERDAAGSFDHQVEFHEEAGTWWAECADLPGFSAAADNREELMRLVDKVLREQFGTDVRWYSFWAAADHREDA